MERLCMHSVEVRGLKRETGGRSVSQDAEMEECRTVGLGSITAEPYRIRREYISSLSRKSVCIYHIERWASSSGHAYNK